LRDINQQLTLARVRTEDGKARSQQVQQALRQRGDLGPLTERLNLGTVTALRGRVAEAQRQLGDLSSDLGPPAFRREESAIRARRCEEGDGHGIEAHRRPFWARLRARCRRTGCHRRQPGRSTAADDHE